MCDDDCPTGASSEPSTWYTHERIGGIWFPKEIVFEYLKDLNKYRLLKDLNKYRLLKDLNNDLEDLNNDLKDLKEYHLLKGLNNGKKNKF